MEVSYVNESAINSQICEEQTETRATLFEIEPTEKI